MQELGSVLLAHALAADDVLEQLTTTSILHDQIKFFLCLDDLVELHYGRVANNLQDVDFTGHSLDIVHVNDLVFLEDLDGHLLTG